MDNIREAQTVSLPDSKTENQQTQEFIGTLAKNPKPTPLGFFNRYWLIILIAAVSLTAFLTLRGTVLEYAQNTLGLLLALWLPGYSLTEALFTSETSFFSRKSGSGRLLVAVFGVVFSIILVALVAFALNFSPWGIQLQSLTVSLSALTILFAFTAMLRQQKIHKIAKQD